MRMTKAQWQYKKDHHQPYYHERLGNKKTNADHLDNSIKSSQNTEKSPGDLLLLSNHSHSYYGLKNLVK